MGRQNGHRSISESEDFRVREIKNADKSLILPGDGESPVEVDVVSGSPAVDCD